MGVWSWQLPVVVVDLLADPTFLQAQIYANQQQLVFLGLYVANERLNDQAIPHGAQKVADALRKQHPQTFVLVVSYRPGQTLGSSMYFS